MKRKNITIVLILALVFSFTNATLGFASKPIENDLVSVEEYIETMKKVYQKYGVELEVLDSSNYTPITRGILESQLKDIEEAGKAMIRAELKEKNTYKFFLKSSLSLDDRFGSENTPFATMPINTTLSGNFTKSSIVPPGFAKFSYSAKATYDANRGYWMSCTPNQTYIFASLNYEEGSVRFSSDEWNIVDGGRNIEAYIRGMITFTWVEPVTNLVLSSTEPFSHSKFFSVP